VTFDAFGRLLGFGEKSICLGWAKEGTTTNPHGF